MYLKVKVCFVVIISILIIAANCFASDTRVHSMGYTEVLLKDNYNIYKLPSAIVNYPNLFILGFGGTNFGSNSGDGSPIAAQPFAGGTIGIMPGHVLGIIVSGEKENLLYTPIETEYQYDIFYGIKLSSIALGARISRASGIDKESGHPENSGLNYEKSASVTGITVSAEMELAGIGTAEGAVNFSSTSFTDETDGKANSKPEGYSSFGLKARLFYKLNDKTDLIPFFSYDKGGAGMQVYYNDEKSYTRTSETSSFDIGCGVNIRPEENMLFVAGIGYSGISGNDKFEPVQGDKDEDEFSVTFFPFFQVGFEVQLKSWLYFRGGAQKLIGSTESKNQVSNDETITTEGSFSPFAFAVGIGTEFKNLTIDLMLDSEYFKRGPFFLSGSSGRMFPRATATYAF